MDSSPPPESEPADFNSITARLLDDLQQAASDIAPNFIRTMPQAYLDGTTQAMRLAHLKAIIAAEASGFSQTVTLREADGARYTFISNRSYPGQLSRFVRQLPRDLPLISAQVYTSTAGNRVLDVFHLGDYVRYDPTNISQRHKADTVLRHAVDQNKNLDNAAMETFLTSCDASYLMATPPEQISRHFQLVNSILLSGDVVVRLEPYHETNLSRLVIGFAEYDPRLVFERISRHLGNRKIDIERAYLDSFKGEGGDGVMLLNFLVQRNGERLSKGDTSWHELQFELRRLLHLDEAVLNLAETVTEGDLVSAELLNGLAHLVHQLLVKEDPFVFSKDRIISALQRFPDLALAVYSAFRHRFATGSSDTESGEPNVLEAIQSSGCNPEERKIFTALLQSVSATLRTNLLLPQRRALALRVNPEFLDNDDRTETPFGVFFVSGYQFNGFHVRFRDIARGGMRIVRPMGMEQYALESERHYDEAYGLAYAQQQKNKDIPEGGSKGVILAAPSADFESAGRAFADSLLDLTIPDELMSTLHADHYRYDELLYLGPDENVSNQLITWIVERAKQRGHPMPDAFMSSKPGAGINHKTYGVTSEGVTVFLDKALRSVGIDPLAQSFSVKITGGPDGDVAGNEILILNREYPDTVRILGIADGSGCAEDPEGLNSRELIRLVESELPITEFDRGLLSPRGQVVSIDEPQGSQLRDSMHNRITADAFIPAGGRPGTINENNWREFLDEEGEPSSRVIVEGANLFISPDAREHLAEHGAIIVKDSSANKAGVICSSYEIIASMLLDEAAFLEIKEEYVAQVLDKLRAFARLEADALFREHLHKPAVHLPELSVRLSRAINKATDAVTERVQSLWDNHPGRSRELVLRHLPPVLGERCGDRVFDTIPKAYLHRIISSSLASKIVYREGLDWLESMSSDSIAQLAEHYFVEEAFIEKMANDIRGSNLENREAIADLLEAGGVAAALRKRSLTDG
ncbi:MAG: NAD-glutamate dehydrogenase domain-containing protein [Gammaproteobacteria bacterium]